MVSEMTDAKKGNGAAGGTVLRLGGLPVHLAARIKGKSMRWAALRPS